jgi:hypothetical protein
MTTELIICLINALASFGCVAILFFQNKEIATIKQFLQNVQSHPRDELADGQDIHVNLHNRLLQLQRDRYAKDYSVAIHQKSRKK